MLSFREYLSEAIEPVVTWKKNTHHYQLAIDACNKLGNQPIVWRGIRTKQNGIFLHVTNDRETFRSGTTTLQKDRIPATLKVLKKLGIEKPIFATTSFERTRFFAGFSDAFVFAYVPTDGTINGVWSPEVEDVGVMQSKFDDMSERGDVRTTKGYKYSEEEEDKKIDSIVSTYQKYTGSNIGENEVILTSESYYAISPVTLLGHTKKSKKATIKSIEQCRTYKDLAKLLEEYREYNNWSVEFRRKNNPNKYVDYDEQLIP